MELVSPLLTDAPEKTSAVFFFLFFTLLSFMVNQLNSISNEITDNIEICYVKCLCSAF